MFSNSAILVMTCLDLVDSLKSETGTVLTCLDLVDSLKSETGTVLVVVPGDQIGQVGGRR